MLGESGKQWSPDENELTVASYLEMLSAELRGQSYVKAEYWRALQELLPARSKGAIEFKYGNISAVLRDLRFPPVDGYKPYSNYQADLVEVVQRQLQAWPDLTSLVATQVDQPAATPAFDDILKVMVARPERAKASRVTERIPWYERTVRPVAFTDLQREARNRSLGAAGEAFVLEFERARLVAAGEERLASKIEHVSTTRGPATGFDILSFEYTGLERLIEVKTTRYSRHTPFFISRNELRTSDEHATQYAIYRLFAFERDMGLFILPGAVRENCVLDATEYEAMV